MSECLSVSWLSFSVIGVRTAHSNVKMDVKICSKLYGAVEKHFFCCFLLAESCLHLAPQLSHYSLCITPHCCYGNMCNTCNLACWLHCRPKAQKLSCKEGSVIPIPMFQALTGDGHQRMNGSGEVNGPLCEGGAQTPALRATVNDSQQCMW